VTAFVLPSTLDGFIDLLMEGLEEELSRNFMLADIFLAVVLSWLRTVSRKPVNTMTKQTTATKEP
jgi:hypothetical protein